MTLGNPSDVSLTTDYVKFSFVFTEVPSTNLVSPYYGFLDIENQGASSIKVYIKDIKIEKGTKATDYSIAPEDTAANIKSTLAALDDSKNKLAVNLGYTNYDALVKAAEAGHTIVDGGLIRTDLIDT